MSSTAERSVEVPRLRREMIDHFAATSEPQSVVCIAEALQQDLLSGIYFHLRVLLENGEIVLHHTEGYSRDFYVSAERDGEAS